MTRGHNCGGQCRCLTEWEWTHLHVRRSHESCSYWKFSLFKNISKCEWRPIFLYSTDSKVISDCKNKKLLDRSSVVGIGALCDNDWNDHSFLSCLVNPLVLPLGWIIICLWKLRFEGEMLKYIWENCVCNVPIYVFRRHFKYIGGESKNLFRPVSLLSFPLVSLRYTLTHCKHF